MSSYNYSNGSTGYNGRSRFGFKFQTGGEDHSNGWSRPVVSGGKDEPRRDHVCKPVIVGPDGRIIDAALSCPPQHHQNGVVGKPAPCTDEVCSPDQYINKYTHNPPSKGQEFKDYILQSPTVQEFAKPNGGERKACFPRGMFQRAQNGYHGQGTTRAETKLEDINGGWDRPSRTSGWVSPPAYEGKLGKVTNNIEEAVNYMYSQRPSSASGPKNWSQGAYGGPAKNYSSAWGL